MKLFKWKIFVTTSTVCLLTILLGIALWDELPEVMAIHFDINNNPDGFASRGFVVFGLPILMVILQAVCCIINDINGYKYGERKKFERVTKWIIPVMTVILQIVTLGYGLGWNLNIRKIVALIVGAVFVAIGNYLPKLDFVKSYDVDTEKARKINRFIGFETVVLGILFILSVFLPAIATIVCLFLLIPYAISGVVYGIKTGRKIDNRDNS